MGTKADFARTNSQTDEQRVNVALALELRGRAWRALILNDYRDADGHGNGYLVSA